VSGGRRPAIESSAVATGKGDDGTTGLLYGGPRISKDDPRTEAYGTVDEAVAALGIARAAMPEGADGTELRALILRFQRELFVVGAELATTPDAWPRLEDGRTRVDESMLAGVEAILADLERRISMPTEFVVAGETPASAALELARTILRRAERRVITLQRDRLVPGPWLTPYLNRLADLVWVMARFAESVEAAEARLAVEGGRRGARAGD
jgi:cob(I)alamin adenosyltransferase